MKKKRKMSKAKTISIFDNFFSYRKALPLIKEMVDSYSALQTSADLLQRAGQVFGVSLSQETHLSSIRYDINNMMLRYYHNEAFIKSSFIKKKLWWGDHVDMFEVPVGNSRIDMAKINGQSIGYEIKTKYDNLSRLKTQIFDYLSVFEYVFVICEITKFKKVKKIVPEVVGIYTYDDNEKEASYTKMRCAKKSPFLSPAKQLECLSEAELKDCFSVDGKKSSLLPLLLSEKTPNQINLAFKRQLKKRYRPNWQFLKENCEKINEIDYQWFYKTKSNAKSVYSC
jgi:hypothetical protein